jgi:hypothetical protein
MHRQNKIYELQVGLLGWLLVVLVPLPLPLPLPLVLVGVVLVGVGVGVPLPGLVPASSRRRCLTMCLAACLPLLQATNMETGELEAPDEQRWRGVVLALQPEAQQLAQLAACHVVFERRCAAAATAAVARLALCGAPIVGLKRWPLRAGRPSAQRPA